ncbi:MAG: indole-3-glycerol phosphate synthase TrpC [Gemmatimonadaceae bacterium]
MQATPTWSPPGGTLGQIVAEAMRGLASLGMREAELTRLAATVPPPPSFADALVRADVGIIAEIKRRSPSRADIRPGMVTEEWARAYQAGGAAAISVLTEETHFGGSAADIRLARAVTTIPILRKDFHLDPLHALEARALGASAMLLIARALSPHDLDTLARAAAGAGVEILIEVRDERELERALAIEAAIIGVNNRDLETLVVDRETANRLIPLVPAGRIAVSESGVDDRSDVERLAAAGADAVLVGSALSASEEPAEAVRALTGVPRQRR